MFLFRDKDRDRPGDGWNEGSVVPEGESQHVPDSVDWVVPVVFLACLLGAVLLQRRLLSNERQ